MAGPSLAGIRAGKCTDGRAFRKQVALATEVGNSEITGMDRMIRIQKQLHQLLSLPFESCKSCESLCRCLGSFSVPKSVSNPYWIAETPLTRLVAPIRRLRHQELHAG
jgi:hypothetical protein